MGEEDRRCGEFRRLRQVQVGIKIDRGRILRRGRAAGQSKGLREGRGGTGEGNGRGSDQDQDQGEGTCDDESSAVASSAAEP